MIDSLLPLFPRSTTYDEAGQLHLAGQRLSALAHQWGTPLYLYDALTLQHQVETLRATLAATYPAASEIAYAAKAYFSLGLARRLAALNLGVDVVSLGELRLAQRAGFAPEKIHLHGNNKSPAELAAALEGSLQAIVVDNLDELELLGALAQEHQRPARLWLRLAPGVVVNTHIYTQTGHRSTKFGLPIADGQAAEAIRRARGHPWLKLVGLHTHLGSQFSEAAAYQEAIAAMYTLARSEDFCPEEFSPGGGWYVRYTPGDPETPLAAWVETVSGAVEQACQRSGWPLPKLILEPGRWLVARAGVAVYTVGACKQSDDGTRWVAVDGGLADNPRPALYGARYVAVAAERALASATQTANLVGKFCESGDFLISAAPLPDLKRGDLLAVPVAGAYQLSMASNYNLAGRPAVLWLDAAGAEVLQTREDPAQAGWWLA